MPSVSIITPTFNRASSIGEMIESVQAQTFQDWELVIVDDGSTDRTRETIEAYANTDRRIQYVWQTNSGTPRARNKAISMAKGKYTAFLDDDDRWLPKKLELQVAFMEANPDIGFCYGRFQIYQKMEDQLKKGRLFPQFLATKFEDLPWAFIPPSSTLFRKSCLEKIGGFSNDYWPCEDFDLMLRFGQRWKFSPIDQILGFTIMDGREHGAMDEILVYQNGIKILRNLELVSPYDKHQWWIAQQIAFRFYEIGRMYLDRKEYWKAAENFLQAVLTDPLVGLRVRRKGESGIHLFNRVLKTYLAIPASLWKGLIHDRR